MPRRIRTAVLISGRGSNMVSLAEAANAPDFPARIDLVISNRPDAEGLQKAKTLGIRAICLDHKTFKSRRGFEQAMQNKLDNADIELICCAGFMRVLTPWFTAQWQSRILNIHPSLLPLYKGLDTHRRALEAGDKEHGCSVHLVNEDLDGGDIIAQARVKIDEHETENSLSTKVLEQELRLYPAALRAIATKIVETSTQN